MRNINWFKLLYSFLLGCLSFITLEAQQVVLPVEQLTVADNLTAQTYNYFVFKDSEGFIWISSINGLNRYDGQEVVQYLSDENDPNAISDVNILGRFYEDKNTNIWFGTDKAIHCYDRKNDRFAKYQIRKDGDLLRGYRLLSIDHKKEELLVATGNGMLNEVYQFSVDKPDSFIYILEYFMSINVDVIEELNSKALYAPLREDSGLAKLLVKNEDENFNVVVDTLLKGEDIDHVFYENDQNIWCVGPGGIYRIDEAGKLQGTTKAYEGTDLKTMVKVIPYGEDQLLIGTRSEGLFLVTKKDVQITDRVYYSKDDEVQPFNSLIDFISVDRDGTIWVSTDGQGVFYLTPGHKKMNTYLQNYSGEFPGRSNIQGITEDQDGLLWCLTKDGIVVIDSSGNLIPEYKYLTESLPLFLEDHVYSILCDHNNQILVCSKMGLYALDLSKKKKTFEQVKLIDASLPNGIISGLSCRNNTTLVSGSVGLSSDTLVNLCKLISTVDGPRLKPVLCKESTRDITRMFEDRNGKVYLCRGSEGILIGNESEGHFLVDTFITENLFVNGLVEDRFARSLWIATQTGLFQLKKEKNSYTLVKNEIFDLTSLNGILLDDDTGYLWISNNNGLHAFHPDSSNYRTFTLKEGLQSREFNFWSALKTSNGLFAFGGTNGVNLFDPKKALKLSAEIPVPKITRILIDYQADTSLVCNNTGAKNVSKFESLKLEYRKNTIAFNFAALDYRDPSANKFQFKMKGVDEDWVYSGNTNSARYPKLPIGTYEFKVKASSAEGIWSDEPDYITTLEIEILAPWYRTWLAYFVYALTVLAIAFAFYRSRINRIRKEEEFKRKEAEFKQKEAEYKQLAAETETAVLRLQMNPHFIFNSMNSISSYILERDVDTANAYLDRFAKLMRMILKLGKQPMIPVADEIDLLDQYMKTEAMRFEQKFNYNFDLGPDIDEDDTFVPTMILQPFVENAIWHGLSGKTKKGNIQIRFWKDTASLFCSIEDDGVGREASKKKKNLAAHKSKALEITRRRLDLLGKKEGKKADFSFEDLLDEAGQAIGTRVLLQIPLL